MQGFLQKIKETSQVALRRYPREPVFDFIYIDGSHMACDVLEDALLCWPLVKDDGIIIFDDYKWCCPVDRSNPYLKAKIALNAFISVFADQLELLEKTQQVVIRKTGENEVERILKKLGPA